VAGDADLTLPPPGSDRDVVLMHGWSEYALAHILRGVGGHRRQAQRRHRGDSRGIAGRHTTHPTGAGLGRRLLPESAKLFGLEETRYEGPTGIAGVFQDACVAAGIPAVTFWAAVPHYVSHPPNPKATVALLRRVEDVLDIEVPLADLPAQAEEWEESISEMAAEDEDLAEYVVSLEERATPRSM